MPQDRQAIEQAVIDAMSAASSGRTARVTRATPVLELVDSLGLVIALGNLQAALNVALDPQELIGIFRCRSIADVALALEGALSARFPSEA